jgi:hypothetical protein
MSRSAEPASDGPVSSNIRAIMQLKAASEISTNRKLRPLKDASG